MQQVFVEIKGAVMYPGVYELEQDQRIKDVVQLAVAIQRMLTHNLSIMPKRFRMKW